jgi:cold-inducible RNA-binding protein
MNIYVGNLSYDATEDELREAFQSFGEVENVTIIRDRFSGESRGFAFVEMATKEQAQSAIAELNGKDFHGRALNVNEARPRTERADRDRRGAGGGGSGSGRRF